MSTFFENKNSRQNVSYFRARSNPPGVESDREKRQVDVEAVMPRRVASRWRERVRYMLDVWNESLSHL